ncbi:MAG: oxaloacetate decarboxylase [Alphaproteobacteria bacterium]|nr:oxaloacetate decarboxylase [Alphaproteobacteria bacterium]
MTSATKRALRAALTPGSATILPGVANALAARVAADCGFAVAYVTGAGIANSHLGIPDNGLVTLSELAGHVAAIRDVFEGPLMVDADTGFGNELNMRRTVRVLERAGADALQIEDQVFPKRCGHFEGKEVVPAADMIAKIKAAVDARTDADLTIVARTDAIAVEGFDAAIDRIHAYREAGADVGFVEAPTTPEQIASIGRLPFPQLANMVIGGKTPELSNSELKRLGFAGVIYANTALQGAVLGMQRALSHLKREGHIGNAAGDLLTPFAERQRLVGFDEFLALERKYR